MRLQCGGLVINHSCKLGGSSTIIYKSQSLSTLVQNTPEVWRLRLYPAERMIAAAKPLWFLPADLQPAKDGCQRII